MFVGRREMMTVGALGAGIAAASQARAAIPGRADLRTGDGTRLFHKDWGEGAPVVFVHAWGMNADFLDYQMVRLASEGLRCIAYDQRGHGRSGDPGWGFDPDTLADDLAGVIAQLGLTRVALVGHSMGGAVIARYLTRHGDGGVGRVALVAPQLPYMTQTPDNAVGLPASLLAMIRSRLMTDRAQFLMDGQAGFFTPTTSKALQDWGRETMLQGSLKAMVDCQESFGAEDFRPDLTAMKTPTLLVHGDADQSVPIAMARAAAALIPGCRFVEYAGAPHGLPVTHIERLNADLLDFLRDGRLKSSM